MVVGPWVVGPWVVGPWVVVVDGVVMPPKSGSRQLHTPFWHCEPQQSPPSQLQAATLFSLSHQLS